MRKIGYFVIKWTSLLPLPTLYIFSDILFFLLRHLIRYRKKVVCQNLKNAFPDLSDQEINIISKRFYRNLSDYIVETIKSFSIHYDSLKRRTEYEGMEFFEGYKKEGKNVMILIGHIFNWEWFFSLGPKLPQAHSYAVFKPVRNAFFNERILEIRSRFDAINIPMEQAAREIMRIPNDGQHAFLVLGDQSPRIDQIYYNLLFFQQDTAVYQGFDKIAKKKNMGVLYGYVIKTGRGQYKISFVPIKPSGKFFGEHEIVKRFFSLLEENIREQPDNWLWSHKRWKHKKGVHF
ncbi:MAG: lysophospholipid acyltransferase family protein [Flavobacteriales bacterium Tduv]